MADDNRLRTQRPADSYRRGPAADQPSGDPLAELARLIGQSDPFADYGRKDGRDGGHRDPPPKASDWRRTAASMPPYDSADEETLRAPSRNTPRHDPYQTAAEDLPEPRYAERPSQYRQEQQYRSEPQYRQEPQYQQEPQYREEPQYRQEPEFRQEPQYRQESQYRQEPQFADEPFYPRQDDSMYAAPTRDPRQQPAYFDDGAPMEAQDEDAYDDPPRPRRRGGLLTAVTLIGCAMIGTAGAYGYRTYYVSPNANRVPPVITAETSPNKVVSAAEGPTGKFIQDRVRDISQNERVVSREEQPVEIRTPTSNPRVVLQSPVSPSQSQSAFPPPPPLGSDTAQGSAPPPTANGNGEPRRVRTLTIRPDGTDDPGRAAPQAPSRPAPRTSRNNGPISLDPQERQTAPAPRERVATAPATTQSLPPAPRAQSEGPAGGYAVQLSSQRSEAEAQSSFRALQGKFPDQLSDRSPIVRRVDLGPKGIYYRALVGPFASSDEAGQFCSELKTAGGQCFIQRN